MHELVIGLFINHTVCVLRIAQCDAYATKFSLELESVCEAEHVRFLHKTVLTVAN